MASFVSSLRQSLSLSRDSKQSTPRTASSLPTSPSFSDFSLGAENEAEYELWRAKSRKTLEQANRGEPAAESTVYGTTSPRDIPKAQEASGMKLSQSQSVSPQRRPEGKIHGMSFYDYHDLIRSSSL